MCHPHIPRINPRDVFQLMYNQELQQTRQLLKDYIAIEVGDSNIRKTSRIMRATVIRYLLV